jgi:hypothetical protein
MKKTKTKDIASSIDTKVVAKAEKPAVESVPTQSDVIWNDIKNIQISLFALPSKNLSEFCKRVTIEPNKCFLVPSVSSLLPMLEEAIGNKYTCETMQKYIIISNK